MSHNEIDRYHYIIAAPHYTISSNGVMAVYQLGDILEALGHKVTFVAHVPKDFKEYRSHYPKKHLDRFEENPSLLPCDSIAILPETTPADIIQKIPSTRRVWYLLNKPYVLTGLPLHYRPEDLVVAFSGLISKAHYNLFLTREIEELSSGPNCLDIPPKKKALILLYFGKSRLTQPPAKLEKLIAKHNAKVIVINRESPKSRDTLFHLLRSARLLISFDPLTNLNYEATLCGTPCYITDNYMHLQYEDYNIPLHGIFEDAQLLEKYYLEGIVPKFQADILAQYHAAQVKSIKSTEGFIQLCRDWFAFTSDASADPLKSQFLAIHNKLRFELDYVTFHLSGRLQITNKHSTHSLNPYQTVVNRWSERKARLLWNTRRNWYKHVLRIRGDDLKGKLNSMNVEFDETSLKNL